jgi:hypothetical protein
MSGRKCKSNNSETQAGSVAQKTQSPGTGEVETPTRYLTAWFWKKPEIPVLHGLKESTRRVKLSVA